MEAMMMETSQWDNEDRREGPRVRLQLKLVLIYPQCEGRPARPMFHGKTHDIGLSGLSMIVDYNVFQEGEVTVVLALPLVHTGNSRKVATSTAEMTYAIHSSKLDAYKIGLTFREFRGDGKALLEAALRQELKENADAVMQASRTRSDAIPPLDSQTLGWW
jgi:hypothetical protein